jgi:multidrug efflux pump subunit AcrA (membrane-fusion protein)
MIEKSKLDLSRTRISSPVDGIVVEDNVEQDSFVAKGAPLVTIEDTSATEVKTSLRMDEVARIWGGLREGGNSPLAAHDIPDTPDKVVFRLGDKVFEWDGLLSRQEGRGLDEKTRTLPCRVIVKEPGQLRALDSYGAPMATLPPGSPGSLLRGMFVEGLVQVEAPMPLVSVPQEVVRPSGDLFVVRDGRLVILRPRPFHTGGGIVAFEQGPDGLQTGDRVVASQLSNPREGMLLSEDVP